VHEAEVRIMDERRRLLERVFSREGADEPVEEFTDPTTGHVERMTRSQWLLAEFDRRHGALAAADDEQAGASAAAEDEDSSTFAGDVETQAPDEAVRMPPSARARRYRTSLPYLAAACGLVLGIVGTLAVQQALVPTNQGTTDAGGPLAAGLAPTQQASGDDAGSLVSGQSGPSVGSGQGDEGATVAAVSNYFATTPQADLPPSLTQGFDATSFRSVAGTIADDATSIYAARRFDGAYCLVAVTRAGRTAETCGTMDDIARRGLSLTEDTIDERYKEPTMVTVTWQTDGTLSWSALPPLG
jgi:hypothetical protein